MEDVVRALEFLATPCSIGVRQGAAVYKGPGVSLTQDAWTREGDSAISAAQFALMSGSGPGHTRFRPSAGDRRMRRP
ncbi:MAG TPA: hypothetical protein VIM30_07950, partial [Candidatus Limnocylindrales bacterium]